MTRCLNPTPSPPRIPGTARQGRLPGEGSRGLPRKSFPALDSRFCENDG